MKKSKKLKCLSLLVAIIIFIIWIAWGNTALELNEYQIKSNKILESFHGFRIAQVSDLHNTEIGAENVNLLEMLKNSKPDIIVITGDTIDSYHTDVAFPKYDSGLYEEDGTHMLVSRGIGNSIFPFRFNNRPEVIVVEIMK